MDRKTPAHPPPIRHCDRPVIIFVTICTRERRAVLASPEVHATLLQAWDSAIGWHVGRYMVMPEHLHFFCSPLAAAPGIRDWISYWKKVTSRLWPFPIVRPVWQRDLWDTQLRRSDSYAKKWEYVVNNPVRRGLVTQSSDWPYQGEIHRLRWF